MSRPSSGFRRSRVGLAAAWLCLMMGLAACAQVPGPAASPPVSVPLPPETDARKPDPKVRGINPADLPREEPDVGVGGLMHEPAQPVQ